MIGLADTSPQPSPHASHAEREGTAVLSGVVGVRLLDVHDLAERFGRGARWAAIRMREMRHTTIGSELFTTEEWLAEWLAAESVPQTNWPKQNLDPLEEAVCSRVIALVGDLARAGRIKVVGSADGR